MVSNEEEVDELDENDEVDDESLVLKPKYIKKFFRMWPRAVFEEKDESHDGDKGSAKSIAEKSLDRKIGVYVLYRDDLPYYVGKATKSLYLRLRSHALNPRAKRFLFWNYFSAFDISPEYIDVFEALLISSMPSVIANSAAPKLPREPLPKAVAKILRDQYRRA